jgi:hypothetical protein
MRRRVDVETGAGDPPWTPLGKPVVSRHEALSRRIREDWGVHGHEGHLPSSAYRLQALYLDFGRLAAAEQLAASVRSALDEAGARDEERARASERVDGLSRRALVTVLVFNAHFWNVKLALEVVGGNVGLEGATLGTCAFVAERRIGRGLGGDLRYYAPLAERLEAFCSDHCLPAIGSHPSEDLPCHPPRTPADCGMLRILEGFRFFASFPDE